MKKSTVWVGSFLGSLVVVPLMLLLVTSVCYQKKTTPKDLTDAIYAVTAKIEATTLDQLVTDDDIRRAVNGAFKQDSYTVAADARQSVYKEHLLPLFGGNEARYDDHAYGVWSADSCYRADKKVPESVVAPMQSYRWHMAIKWLCFLGSPNRIHNLYKAKKEVAINEVMKHTPAEIMIFRGWLKQAIAGMIAYRDNQELRDLLNQWENTKLLWQEAGGGYGALYKKANQLEKKIIALTPDVYASRFAYRRAQTKADPNEQVLATCIYVASDFLMSLPQ